MGTQVALNDRLWIRRYVNLPSVPPGGFRLVGYFDNTFQLFINGVLASDGSTSTNAGVTKLLSAGLFVPGVNVVAVRCDDDAAVAPTDACYFDFLLDPIYG